MEDAEWAGSSGGDCRDGFVAHGRDGRLLIEEIKTECGIDDAGFILAVVNGLGFLRSPMSTIPTADLLALDTDGIAVRLSKLRGYL